MKYKANINERASVHVEEINGVYHAKVYINKCGNTSMFYKTDDYQKLNMWIDKIREVLNGKI